MTSQDTFVPTPYEDEQWEIVGAPPTQLEFNAMPVPVLGSKAVMIDPMFADYGGRIADDTREIPHEHPSSARRKSDEPVIPMVSMPEAEFHELVARERAAGVEEGRREALARHNAELESVKQELSTMMKDVVKQLGEQLTTLERRAVTAVLELSRRLTFETVEMNPEYIAAVVREALALTGGAFVKTIRVSPQDKEFIDVVGLDEKTLGTLEGSWEFVADETVRAGCIVETSAGTVDVQLDKAWERYRDKILKAVPV